MKNKKGFTLIELLCVIVLLAIITVIASTGVVNLAKSSKNNLYCAKVKMIESLARDYSAKLEKELNQSAEYYEGYKSIKITVNDLVLAGKLEADNDDEVISPIDNTKMNDLEIIIYLKNNQIYAVLPENIC